VRWQSEVYRHVPAPVAGGEGSESRHRKRREAFAEDGFHGNSVTAWERVGEVTDQDGGDAIQGAGGEHGGEHAIDAVGGFRDVLEEQDGAVGKSEAPRGNTREEHREISARERASRGAAVPGRQIREATELVRTFEGADPFDPSTVVAAPEAGEVVGVETRHAGALSLDVQRRDIREPDDPFRLVAKGERVQ
jgi:hypothetical protein